MAVLSWTAATHANHIQTIVAQTQAMTLLVKQSDELGKDVETNGVGDPRRLTEFFYLLGVDRQKDMIPQEFYTLQIRKWCPLTRAAHAKLAINWQDAAFRTEYGGSPWFLTMLDKLAGQSEKDTSGCL